MIKEFQRITNVTLQRKPGDNYSIKFVDPALTYRSSSDYIFGSEENQGG